MLAGERRRVAVPRSTARPGTTRSTGRRRWSPPAPATPRPAPCAPCELLDLARAGRGRRRVHRRHRRRGRRAGRAADERPAAGLAVLVRPGEQAGQAAGRRAGQVAGAEGHEGRRRRRGAHGLAAGDAVRAAARRCRSCSPTSTRRAWTRASAYVHGELDKLAAARPAVPGRAQPAQGPGHRFADQGRLRRRRPRHRGRVRGDVGQAAGVRRGRGGRVARVRAGDQHLGAVDHRDGVEARAPRAGRRPALLQPGRGAAAARGRARRADRRRDAGHGVRRRQGAEEVLRARAPTPRRSWSTGCSPASSARSPPPSSRARRSPSPTGRSTRWACR